MRKHLLSGVAFTLALAVTSVIAAQASSQQQAKGDPAGAHSTDATEAALLDQIKCQRAPHVAQVINTMLKSRLIRYVDNENGAYLFEPTVPLKLWGVRIIHISGFDDAEAFYGVPDSTMVGTAGPVFLEIDVAAPVGELRKRALGAGLVEAAPSAHKRGFDVSADGLASYLAGKRSAVSSSIRCIED